MNETVIRTEAPRIHDDEVVWVGHLDDRSGTRTTVTHTFTCPDPSRFTPTPRPWLLTYLLPAMVAGDPVRIDGPLDEGTVAGVMEWQETMATWHPGRLRVVAVRSDLEPSPHATTERAGAATAFSGGVDSCYSAVRNRPGTGAVSPPRRHGAVAAGVMVHGFDIATDQRPTFDRAFDRSSAILASLQVAPFRFHTDVRAVESRYPVDWETASHGIWLAAALSCYEQWFERTLIPATYTYGSLHLPWASNPVTDPLLGSGTTPLWHDGAAADKLDKVTAIAEHEVIERNLRVCWEGALLDRNCGHCYKCTMTQACWWLCGIEHPRCFHDAAVPGELARLDFGVNNRRPLGEHLHRRATEQGHRAVAAALAEALER